MAFDFLNHFLDTPNKVVVTIGIDDDKARSLAQNRLYWKWLHQLKQQTGQDLHLYFKRLFLSKIYARDDGDFAQMVGSVAQCKGLLDDWQYENLANNVIKNISTTKASVKQMSEYLNKIEIWAFGQGLTLTMPSELEWLWLPNTQWQIAQYKAWGGN
ncbi:hypothetical protein [Moraxella sp. ZY200743]|uniref:hypothetical protein n=1 Tax=Moraxella sp. ZY200743 TaxID=2911970 RepID=UPI003D7D2DD7